VIQDCAAATERLPEKGRLNQPPFSFRITRAQTTMQDGQNNEGTAQSFCRGGGNFDHQAAN
jgi:hypothetical protein